MWLGLPLFVFPTQSDMTGAISTPSHSHSQGPLPANFPLLMIHSSVKATMFAYGAASCTWHRQRIFFYKVCSKYIGRSLLLRKLTKHRRTDRPDICDFLRMMETFNFSWDPLYFRVMNMLSIIWPIMFKFIALMVIFYICCLQPVFLYMRDCGNYQTTWSCIMKNYPILDAVAMGTGVLGMHFQFVYSGVPCYPKIVNAIRHWSKPIYFSLSDWTKFHCTWYPQVTHTGFTVVLCQYSHTCSVF